MTTFRNQKEYHCIVSVKRKALKGYKNKKETTLIDNQREERVTSGSSGGGGTKKASRNRAHPEIRREVKVHFAR